MSDYAVKKIDDIEAIFGGAFKRARAELGVESFGMQVLDLPPNLPHATEVIGLGQVIYVSGKPDRV